MTGDARGDRRRPDAVVPGDRVAPGMEPLEQFDVIEVYYDDVELPTAWCAETLSGDTLKELYSDLTKMVDACGKPVINEDDLPGATK